MVDAVLKHQYSPTRQELTAIAASNQKIAGMQQGRLSITTNGDWNFKPLSEPRRPHQLGRRGDPPLPRTKKTASIANLLEPGGDPRLQGPGAGLGPGRLHPAQGDPGADPPQLQEVPAGGRRPGPTPTRRRRAAGPTARPSATPSRPSSPPAHDLAPATDLSVVWDKWRNDMWDDTVTVQEGLRQMQEELQKVVDQYRR